MELQPKSFESLGQQIETAESNFETKGVLLPPSESRVEMLAMTATQLKERYSVRYEAYLASLRANESRNPFQADHASFFRQSKEQMVDYLSILNRLDEYIWTHGELQQEGQHVLRQGQINAFEAIRSNLEAGETEGYIDLPTGFGKTVIFSQLVEATQTRTIICVPTKQLVD